MFFKLIFFSLNWGRADFVMQTGNSSCGIGTYCKPSVQNRAEKGKWEPKSGSFKPSFIAIRYLLSHSKKMPKIPLTRKQPRVISARTDISLTRNPTTSWRQEDDGRLGSFVYTVRCLTAQPSAESRRFCSQYWGKSGRRQKQKEGGVERFQTKPTVIQRCLKAIWVFSSLLLSLSFLPLPFSLFLLLAVCVCV